MMNSLGNVGTKKSEYFLDNSRKNGKMHEIFRNPVKFVCTSNIKEVICFAYRNYLKVLVTALPLTFRHEKHRLENNYSLF